MTLKLRTQYTLAIASLVALALLLFASAGIYSATRSAASRAETLTRVSRDYMMAEARHQAESVSQLVADNIVNSFYFYDMEAMENVLAAARLQPDVITTSVFDASGAIVMDGSGSMRAFGDQVPAEALAALASTDGAPRVRTTEDALYVTRPLLMGGEAVGGVTVGLSLADVNSRMGQLQADLEALNAEAAGRGVVAMFATAAFLIALGAVLASGVADRLARPIHELADAAAAIGEGESSVRVGARGSREINELVESFNSMADDLERTTVSRDRLEEVVEQLKHEIRERHEAEQGRREMEERLQRAQKMEALGMLAGGVAHDLNNILTGIVSYPELLLRQLPDGDPMASSLRTIQSSGERAAAVVQDLLTMARRGVASMEQLSISDLIDDYVATPEHCALQVGQPGVSVQVDHIDGDLWVSGSSVHLMKSVGNLVQNAFEAIPDDGTVRITTRKESECDIHELEGRDTGFAVIEVSDTGTGIRPEDLERIFEPFYTKKKLGRSGSGLGMAVVWGTVDDHGGHIAAASEPGEGTTFTIRIPLVDRPAARETTPSPSRAFDGRGERILVVDDVAEQREIATKLLTLMGYRAEAVASGEEAVEHIRENECDLLVLDMIMDPGIDGLETYERVLKVRPGMPAVIASGYSESDRVERACELGAAAYVRKPYLADQLGEAIHTALHETRGARTGQAGPPAN